MKQRMKRRMKRFLSGLMALIMAVPLVSVQAFAALADDPADAPYYLFITHTLELDEGTYGTTEVVELTEDDFREDGYDFSRHVIDREGMQVVRGSYLDNYEFDLVESWVVTPDDFIEAGDFEDDAGYYGIQLLIEYETAPGYKAVVSDASSAPGEYDAMPLASFKGPLTGVTFTGVDIITLTLKFEYSRTGGLAGTAAADTVVVEVPITRGADGKISTIAPIVQKITPKEGFRMLLNPYPLNQFLENPELATELTRAEYTDAVHAQIETALADGSFSVVPDKVYKNKTNVQGGYTDKYNAAWDLARIVSATEAEIRGIATKYNVEEKDLKELIKDSLPHDYYYAAVTGGTSYPGAASVGDNPTLTVEITPEQAEEILRLQTAGNAQALEDATTVTVYYRRNATSYTVKHWVPQTDALRDYESGMHNGETYAMVYSESLQGRVGALTNAKDSPAVVPAGEDGNHFDFTPYVPEGFSQLEIKSREDENDEGTVVDIYYKNAGAYRVIFNTDYTYIPRQLVPLNSSLEFGTDSEGNTTLKNGDKLVKGYRTPTRTGYTFAGWRYQLRDGHESESGAYVENGVTYVDIARNGSLDLTSELISKAVITQAEESDSDGIKALYLYPKWDSGNANVRVVFWVEDLSENPADDVQVSISKSPNKSTYLQTHNAYTGEIVSGSEDAAYSNVGGVLLNAKTGDKLGLSVANNELTDSESLQVTVSGETKSLTEAIAEQFKNAVGKVETTNGSMDTDAFYSPVRVEVTGAQVASDGSTVINVYYNRNIYSLDFTYYGHRGTTQYIASNTKGFSRMNNPDPEEAGRYGENDNTGDGTSQYNRFRPVTSTEADFGFPERITIHAKYGADLREVWPVSAGETVTARTADNTTTTSTATFYFISWATTAGPYNAYFNGGTNTRESTLMGVYSSMGADIIANPSEPGTTHHLYAYWINVIPSYYRYNHCYEIPQLDADKLPSQTGVITHSIFSNRIDRANVLYLVPCAMIDAYGYTDLMKVKYNSGSSAITAYEDEDGYESVAGTEYYAIRVFDSDCYAVARRVSTVSTNSIQAQNPSARLHLTKVRTGTGDFPYAPDHSTEWNDDEGVATGSGAKPAGSEGSPYDLYFYYTRDRYTIHYVAPVNRADANETERELGTMEVPYGTVLTNATYNIRLEYPDKNDSVDENGAAKYAWTPTSGSIPVCPDRSEDGKAEWYFGGWHLDWACTTAATAVWDNPISSDVSLYAKWTNNGYKVTFDWGSGATLSSLEEGKTVDDYKTQTIAANTRFTATGLIPRPVWANHTLVGWYVADEDGNPTDVAFDFDQQITANIHVVAEWAGQETKTYDYTVWYLCKVDDDYVAALGERVENDPAGQSGKFLVLGEDPIKDARYPENTTLWLTAQSFSGYTPVNANESVVLSDTPANNVAVFLYTRNATSKYSIEFVRAGTEEDREPEVVSTESKDNITSPSTSVTNAMFANLQKQGYQLVNRTGEDGNYTYTPVESSSDLQAVVDDADKVTYLVQPVVYEVSYTSGAAEFTTADGATVSQGLLDAAAAALDDVTYQEPPTAESNVDAAQDADRNPTRYIVEDRFTLQNPTYIQDPDTKAWWQFIGWTFKENGVVTWPSARANGDTALEVDNSVGQLTFYANWVRVTPNLTVKNEVVSAVPNMTVPGDAFAYTVDVPVGASPEDVLAYYASSGARIDVVDGTIDFSLKNGEEVCIVGPTGSYTITEITDGTPSFDANQKNYYTLDSIAAGGTSYTSGNAVSVDVAGVVSAVFHNTYHATVWLDPDGDPTNENDGTSSSFAIEKVLLENGQPRDFFGGNQYGILIRAGAQSAHDTPVPGKIALSSVAGMQKISNSFAAVRFTQPGTYTYVISEERPSGTSAVPGVTYDNTMYRVTVEVAISGQDLTARVTKLETRDTPDFSDDGVIGWTEKTLAVSGSLTGELLFQNTYNPAIVSRSYEFTKRLDGNRPYALEEGEFTFTVTRVGSHVMTQAEATEYHATGEEDPERLAMLEGFEYEPDSAQRLPSGVDPETGKVSNGITGAISIGSLDYTAENMGGKLYGKVYKYTITEDVPEGIIGGASQGMTYDQSTKTLYVYVHLHDESGNLAQLGDPDTVVYADVFGDRNAEFVNTFDLTPIFVEIGEDPENPDDPDDPDHPGGGNAATAQIVKRMSGRDFTNGDTFTFNLEAVDGAPLPQRDGVDCTQVVITPTSGSSAPVSFGAIAFALPGTYTYKLTEVQGNASNVTYDTAEKVLTIRVHDDDGDHVLNAEISDVTWTNTYRRPSSPSSPGTSVTPSVKDSDDSGSSKPAVALNTEDHFAYIVGKEDGLAHPEDYITRAEVATIFYRLLTEDSRKAYWMKTNPYPDVQMDDWFNVAVSVISNAGIISGGSDGLFAPYKNITRGEFATIAARFLSDPYIGGDYYTDISGHWAREYINRAAAIGWTGDFDMPFRPDDFITRAEVMAIINAMIGRTPDKEHMHEDMIVWPDNMDTSKWYYEDVQEATNSHEYVRIGNTVEDWTEILPVRNWAEIEQAWSDIYDSQNPGDVV